MQGMWTSSIQRYSTNIHAGDAFEFEKLYKQMKSCQQTIQVGKLFLVSFLE